MKEESSKEVYFKSYEIDTYLTLPRKEKITTKVLKVLGVNERGEEVELTKVAEKGLTLEDYLEIEERLIKMLFITSVSYTHLTLPTTERV